MDKAMKQKDLVVHASCKANYDALARYQCFAYQGFVEWVHQSQFVGAFQASEEVVEDMPMFSGFDLGGPSDTPQTKDLRSKGVDLSSFFDDGRTPRNLEHMKNSLLAALQTAKTYGIPGDVEAAQTELDQFLRENPTLL